VGMAAAVLFVVLEATLSNTDSRRFRITEQITDVIIDE
jgi:hypothetical protein